MLELSGLPGAGWVERGLRDMAAGRNTQEALALWAAAGRLRSLGLTVPEPREAVGEPEQALFASLQREGGDPFYRYNAIRRELDSFLAALEQRLRRQSGPATRPSRSPPR